MKILSQSNEDYLEAILRQKEKNNKVRSVDISKILNVSKPAVNKAMNELKENGYIEKADYGDIILTEIGYKRALEVYEKHLFIKKWLISIGVSEKQAEEDCCKIEHIISNETLECLKKMQKQN